MEPAENTIVSVSDFPAKPPSSELRSSITSTSEVSGITPPTPTLSSQTVNSKRSVSVLSISLDENRGDTPAPVGVLPDTPTVTTAVGTWPRNMVSTNGRP